MAQEEERAWWTGMAASLIVCRHVDVDQAAHQDDGSSIIHTLIGFTMLSAIGVGPTGPVVSGCPYTWFSRNATTSMAPVVSAHCVSSCGGLSAADATSLASGLWRPAPCDPDTVLFILVEGAFAHSGCCVTQPVCGTGSRERVCTTRMSVVVLRTCTWPGEGV